MRPGRPTGPWRIRPPPPANLEGLRRLGRIVPREPLHAKRRRAAEVVDALAKAYPRSTCALDHDGQFQLLVATLLSAQTTDASVNRVTRDLFARFPTPEDMAQAPVEDIGAAIAAIGLWRQKAKHVQALSRRLVEEHEGRVPPDLDALTALPGVGRKTATAVLGTAFGIPAGITVDTHMLRVNRLLRLSTATDPARMAVDLERLLPPEAWGAYTHRIIDHGRAVCVARRPRCGVCPLAHLCPSAFDAKIGHREANDTREPASARHVSWKIRHP